MAVRFRKVVWPKDLIKDTLWYPERSGELYRLCAEVNTEGAEIRVAPPVSSLAKITAMKDAETVFSWRKEWEAFVEKWKDIVFLETKTARIGTLQKQVIPYALHLSAISDAFILLGKQDTYKTFHKNLKTFMNCDARLKSWVVHEYDEFKKENPYVPQFLQIAEFLKPPVSETSSWVYKRELSIPGVDTKFLEKHVRMIRIMYNALHETNLKNQEDMWSALHVTTAPEDMDFVPLRLTLPNAYGVKNIHVLKTELSDLTIHPKNVFIVENKESFYHFPELPDTIVIFGRGLAVANTLKNVKFLEEAEHIYYWSDLDTDGFTMLSRMRGVYPKVESFLMDREAIEASKVFLGKDKGSEEGYVDHLTLKEKDAYYYMHDHRYRIEQEQIPWKYVLKKVNELLQEWASHDLK